ncbi:MAG: right-handed parallel beta-helix repeat-containing protein [Candidatus Bathyarchaeia archaeon]
MFGIKKAFVIFIVCLMIIGMFLDQPVKAQAQINITISPNGSLSPLTAPVKQTGDIYELTRNLEGTITIERNNTVLNGNGYDVYGECEVNDFNYVFVTPPVGSSIISNVTIENLTVFGSYTGCLIGIELSDAAHSKVINDTVAGVTSLLAMNGEFYCGVDVEGGGSNVISGNTLLNDLTGTSFSETQHNLVVDNIILDNASSGGLGSCCISFWNASNNMIYHNDFIDNITYGVQACDGAWPGLGSPDSNNTWDDGYPNGGNYWGDYWKQNPDAGEVYNSGILNMPYVIDPKNKDLYPLQNPFNATLYALETVPPKISILSPLSMAYKESTVALVFTVDKAATRMGYSLDGKQTVPVTGNVTVANMTNGLHSLTVYANDTFGDIGSATVNFTIAKPVSFPTVPVAAASAASAIAIIVGLAFYFKKRRR